jgi:hypothetical protein
MALRSLTKTEAIWRLILHNLWLKCGVGEIFFIF